MALIVGVLGGAALFWGLLSSSDRNSPEPAPLSAEQPRTPKVFTVPLPAEAPIFLPGQWQSLAISPDGRRVVYTSRSNKPRTRPLAHTKLRVLDLATSESWTVTGSDGAFNPFFSPDGNWIGYFTSGAFMKVPVEGLSDPILLTSVPPISAGGSWGQRAIEAIEAAPFLSPQQKRDVLYNNAKRFMGFE